LMQAHGVSEPEAFRWIQRTAMDRRTDMRTVAHLVIDTLGTPTDTAGAP
ncbi:ANTAR domain-containing protein, partial [Mycobacterium kansasii]